MINVNEKKNFFLFSFETIVDPKQERIIKIMILLFFYWICDSKIPLIDQLRIHI